MNSIIAHDIYTSAGVPIKPPPFPDMSSIRGRFSCAHCDLEFDRFDVLVDHERRVHGVNR